MTTEKIDTKHKVVYFYDSKTGVIREVNSSVRHDADEFLKKENCVVSHGGYIPAVHTTTHHHGGVYTEKRPVDALWSFVLDENGKPKVDAEGNHLVNPPPYDAGTPSISHYLLKGMVNAGHLNVVDMEPEFLHRLNWAFDNAGLAPVKGTSLVARPIHQAICTSKHLVRSS